MSTRIIQESSANIASIADALESFAKGMSSNKITVLPITMIGEYDKKTEDPVNGTCQDDRITMIGHDDTLFSMIDEAEGYQDEYDIEPEEHCCSGCMECLGLSWIDFF